MKALLFGGGKIARGFLAHLLYLSDARIVIFDVNEQLVQSLKERPSYHIHIMGNPERDCDIRGCQAYLLSDTLSAAREWVNADVAFTAVGGKNLPALANTLAEIFRVRCNIAPFTRPFNIVTCENWTEPAKVIKEGIRACLNEHEWSVFERWVGVSEAVVMRSAVEPTAEMLERDPLCVCVQDFWDLPVDRDRIKGEPPTIQSVRYIDQFAGFLERKFYTYNAANGTVSYLGYLRKHKYIYEAASDPAILPILDGVYRETAQALAEKHHSDLQDQLAFAQSSKKKLQDRNIIDYIERNARDPIRKLGPNDRLVGSARLALQYGVVPESLATAIAAAIHYDHPDDPIAQELRELRLREGVDSILQNVCKLSADDPLAQLVKQKIETLQTEGWIPCT